MSESGTILDYLARTDEDDVYTERRAEMAGWSFERLYSRLIELGVPKAQLGGLPKERTRVVDTVIELELARRPVSKEGRPADIPLGVCYQAPWEQPGDGFNEHARRSARALVLAGCPVHLRSMRPFIGQLDPDVERASADMTRASISRYSAWIHQVVPSPGLLERLTTLSASAARVCGEKELALLNACRVLYTVWERTPAPPDDVKALSRVGQAWVACHDSARMLIDSGVPEDKVRVVPIPYFPDDPHLALQGRKRRPGPPRFLHIGKWEPRKAQDKLLGAFLRAFKPGEAELYFKTSQFAPKLQGYPQSAPHALQSWITGAHKKNGWRWPTTRSHDTFAKELGAQGIKIYQAMMPASALVSMHADADVYLSLSRGEGFDMPAFDSKLAGNLLVYTPSGGPQDFADDSDIRVEPHRRVPTHPLYGWPNSTYLDYEVDAAAEAMRAAAARVKERAEKGSPALEEFRIERVGQRMKGYLEEVLAPLGGKVH